MTLVERHRMLRWGLGLADDRAALDALVARYAEPHRAYHTAAHIESCLALLDALRGEAERPAEAACALLYHDAVYDPTRSDNEAKSAALAVADLSRAGAARDVIARIEAMILATASHETTAGGDAALVLDVDLSVLGADGATFDAYERDVRREYAFVPDALFRSARAAIVERFLARPHVYATPAVRELREQAARANLARSLAALRA